MATPEKKVGLKRWFRDARYRAPDMEITARGLILPNVVPACYSFYDDFDGFTIGASGVSAWIKNEVGTGTGAVVQSLNNGVIKFVTGSTANDNINYQWGNNATVSSPVILATGKRAWLSCRFATEDADQDEFHLGLMTSQTNPFGTEPADQFRFRPGATPDVMQFAVGTTNSTEKTITLNTKTDGVYCTLAAFWDGVDTCWAYAFNETGEIITSGSTTVTATTAADLLPDGAMTHSFGGRTIDTGADDFFVDFYSFVQER